ncbi:MAG: PAS domain-containing sensor histidine kinase [Eubacterium sp.]|nr:PAS domain-containing sensor histidine kinase [Eubacterium sp.]
MKRSILRRSIFLSISGTVIIVLAAVMILVTAVLYRYFSSVQQSGMKMETELIAKAVEDEGISFIERLEEENYRITYIRSDGSVLYDSAGETDAMQNHLDREEVRQAMKEGYGESYRYSDTLLERRNYSAKKLPDGSIIRLSSGHLTLLSLILTMMPYAAAIGLSSLLMSLLLASRLSVSIMRPLNGLNLDHPEDNQAYEELQPLLERIGSQQKQLKQAEQMRREFTANVSHELKTPLHSISGYAELLRNGLVKSEDAAMFYDRIYSEAQRMIVLVEDIIRLSHLDEGAADLLWENVDLYELAEKNLDILRGEAEAAHISMELSGEHVKLYGCAQLISSIIYNLCDNAIKYNKEAGCVRIWVERAGTDALLSVSDTGIGIPREEHDRIFERFYRVDKSRSKAVGGTGLGLSIVKHAAMLHQARIEIESQPGRGTKISVLFPQKKKE